MAVLVPAGCGRAADLAEGEPVSEPTNRPTQTQTPTQAPTAPSADLEQFYSQQVQWSDCGTDYECATVEVPLDYDDIAAGTVGLQLKKAPATSEDDRVGTLFINPGGPGGSGLSYLDVFVPELATEMRDAYDVVGFDPRGVGSSDPVTCLSADRLDEFLAFDPDPDTAAEERRAAALVSELGEACQQNTGALASHVSTIEVAKDLDILRAVVGDEVLHYYGASYGTYIGSTYAELFPDNVGRMVLDGALDPQLSIEELNLEQAEGFQTALEAYAADCVSSGCPFGDSEAQVLQRIESFLDGLDAEPLATDDPERPLTESLGFYGIAVTLYNEDYWVYLTPALEAALDGDGSQLLLLADTYTERSPSGEYLSNSTQVNYAVNCLDHPVDITVAEIKASEDEYEARSPVFGRVFAWSLLGCANWPIQPDQEPLAIDAAGAEPIVVVGTTRDPATPYQWAQALAEQLESGVLVSRDGNGHTGYHMGNTCVDDAIDAYLIDGEVPEDRLEC
jgi:pimeloyl-ACP methyl ester carboxylesterase